MNVELAIKVYNHITEFPQNHTELVWGDTNELGVVASIGGYCALFAGVAKVKNKGVFLTEVDQKEPDWVKTTQELLDIPFNTAFRICLLCDEEQATKALWYLTQGKLPNWKAIYGIKPYGRIV